MEHKFKIGDRVRINRNIGFISLLIDELQPGTEGTVAQFGNCIDDKGVVVVNPNFRRGSDTYPEHGIWIDEKHLDLVD